MIILLLILILAVLMIGGETVLIVIAWLVKSAFKLTLFIIAVVVLVAIVSQLK